jgi:hypothetical protein
MNLLGNQKNIHILKDSATTRIEEGDFEIIRLDANAIVIRKKDAFF